MLCAPALGRPLFLLVAWCLSMNDRNQAIEILKEARDLLADELTQSVLDLREEILDDASGESYMSDIETLYDKYGNRLGHLSTLISSLPAQSEEPIEPPPGMPNQQPSEMGEAGPPHPALALPAPSEVSNGSSTVTFQDFAVHIRSGEIDAAGTTLETLLGVDATRARECARTFYDKISADPEVLFKAMRLRIELASGGVNGPLMLLWDCFGLQGMEAVQVMQTLRVQATSGA